MAPNISVPMNFGIRLLDSPTHSTLQLKASEGQIVKASSVILSYNSPVIDHMTTTLHLTSVDMEEFSDKAVRYFVDAAYSGESPPISRDLFRDVNKIANVFKMSWLVTRCVEQFAGIAEEIQQSAYQDFSFLFDEAVYVLSELKSRQLVEVALGRIQSLNAQQDFISRYLENLTSMSRYQVDLIIELAGTCVEYIVKPLTEKLTAGLPGQGFLVLDNLKYILENINLCHCRKYNTELYEGLFDLLEGICTSQDDFKWILGLQRKSSKKSVKSMENNAASSVTSIVQSDDSYVIPNLFHTLDCSLTFDEVIDWLGKADEVKNLWMFMEGLWTWSRANRGSKIECSSKILDKLSEIRTQRQWEKIIKGYMEFFGLNDAIQKMTSFTGISEEFVGDTRWSLAITDNSVSLREVFSLFEGETKLSLTTNYTLPSCSTPGECGFIIKSVPADNGPKLFLSTDPNDYSDTIHYHSEIKAEYMHFFIEKDIDILEDEDILLLSWAGRPIYQDDKIIWAPPFVTDAAAMDTTRYYGFLLFQYKSSDPGT